MRLGAPIFPEKNEDQLSPADWAAAVQAKGYRAAYAPVGTDADDATVSAYREAAAKADIVIAEVGAWSSPVSEDEEAAAAALEKCIASLDLAERLGAVCCVNVAGSRSAGWARTDPRNLTDETFDMIVEATRRIIDSVKPKKAFYCTETMPWLYPDTVDNYLRLVQAVDRAQYGVHCDPVNMVSSPQRYYANGNLIGEFFAKLGPMIKSCHAKDTIISDELTIHISETRPGTGALDYKRYLSEANALHADLPFMIEHLKSEEEYDAAAAYIRSVATELDIAL
jgi:sugar phosphate isomerase/epimerase